MSSLGKPDRPVTAPVTNRKRLENGQLIKSSPFELMTGFDKPKNIYIGNTSLRGNDVHEARFVSSNLTPMISSNTFK
jgi:hypothetical protein